MYHLRGLFAWTADSPRVWLPAPPRDRVCGSAVLPVLFGHGGLTVLILILILILVLVLGLIFGTALILCLALLFSRGLLGLVLFLVLHRGDTILSSFRHGHSLP